MMKVKRYGIKYMIVGVLHDVIEDSNWTLKGLVKEGLGYDETSAVDLLTKRRGQKYSEYIDKISVIKIPCIVKIRDLEHNMKIYRIKNRRSLTTEDMERLKRYLDAWTKLTGR